MNYTKPVQNCQMDLIKAKLQKELDTYEYQSSLRSARTRCVNHTANLRSTCAGCRAAAWMDILHSMEDQPETEVQSEETQVKNEDVKQEPEDEKPQIIAMPNVIKTEQ